MKDKELTAAQPKTRKGFGNLREAQDRKEIHKIYSRGFMAGKYAAEHPSILSRRRSKTPQDLIFMTKFKKLVESITVLFRTFSYDFLKGAADSLNAEQDKSKFELFYRTMYDNLNGCLQKLYRIVVEGDREAVQV